jgi:hypothetical protein
VVHNVTVSIPSHVQTVAEVGTGLTWLLLAGGWQEFKDKAIGLIKQHGPVALATVVCTLLIVAKALQVRSRKLQGVAAAQLPQKPDAMAALVQGSIGADPADPATKLLLDAATVTLAADTAALQTELQATAAGSESPSSLTSQELSAECNTLNMSCTGTASEVASALSAALQVPTREDQILLDVLTLAQAGEARNPYTVLNMRSMCEQRKVRYLPNQATVDVLVRLLIDSCTPPGHTRMATLLHILKKDRHYTVPQLRELCSEFYVSSEAPRSELLSRLIGVIGVAAEKEEKEAASLAAAQAEVEAVKVKAESDAEAEAAAKVKAKAEAEAAAAKVKADAEAEAQAKAAKVKADAEAEAAAKVKANEQKASDAAAAAVAAADDADTEEEEEEEEEQETHAPPTTHHLDTNESTYIEPPTGVGSHATPPADLESNSQPQEEDDEPSSSSSSNNQPDQPHSPALAPPVHFSPMSSADRSADALWMLAQRARQSELVVEYENDHPRDQTDCAVESNANLISNKFVELRYVKAREGQPARLAVFARTALATKQRLDFAAFVFPKEYGDAMAQLFSCNRMMRLDSNNGKVSGGVVWYCIPQVLESIGAHIRFARTKEEASNCNLKVKRVEKDGTSRFQLLVQPGDAGIGPGTELVIQWGMAELVSAPDAVKYCIVCQLRVRPGEKAEGCKHEKALDNRSCPNAYHTDCQLPNKSKMIQGAWWCAEHIIESAGPAVTPAEEGGVALPAPPAVDPAAEAAEKEEKKKEKDEKDKRRKQGIPNDTAFPAWQCVPGWIQHRQLPTGNQFVLTRKLGKDKESKDGDGYAVMSIENLWYTGAVFLALEQTELFNNAPFVIPWSEMENSKDPLIVARRSNSGEGREVGKLARNDDQKAAIVKKLKAARKEIEDANPDSPLIQAIQALEHKEVEQLLAVWNQSDTQGLPLGTKVRSREEDTPGHGKVSAVDTTQKQVTVTWKGQEDGTTVKWSDIKKTLKPQALKHKVNERSKQRKIKEKEAEAETETETGDSEDVEQMPDAEVKHGAFAEVFTKANGGRKRWQAAVVTVGLDAEGNFSAYLIGKDFHPTEDSLELPIGRVFNRRDVGVSRPVGQLEWSDWNTVVDLVPKGKGKKLKEAWKHYRVQEVAKRAKQ